LSNEINKGDLKMIKTIKSANKYPQIAFIIDKQEILTGKKVVRVSLRETNEKFAIRYEDGSMTLHKNPLKTVWI
jgi:hypothetical protein